MAVLRDRPYPGSSFLVDLGDGEEESAEAGVANVDLPEATLISYDYRIGNEKDLAPKRVQAGERYSPLVLRRGVIGSLRWYRWWREARDTGAAQRDVRVTLLDEARQPVLQWRFIGARPVSHSFTPLDALGDAEFSEVLEIAFERMEIE
jgi:phage tail-like protein